MNNNFVLFGCNNDGGIEILSKINNSGEQIWYEELPFSGVTYAEQPMQETENGFICYMMHDSIIYLIQTDENGIVSIHNNEIISINELILSNYPNPFNMNTNVYFEATNLHKNARIEIYNIKGGLVCELEIRNLKLGINTVVWTGTDNNHNQVSSGIYLYRIKSDGFVSKTAKMTLIK